MGDPVPGATPLPPLAPDLGHDEDYSSPRISIQRCLHVVLARMLGTGGIPSAPVQYPLIGPGLCRILDPSFREFAFQEVRE